MGDAIGLVRGRYPRRRHDRFNDKTWIDRAGLPHSDQLHLVERIRRPSSDALEIKIYDRRSQGVYEDLSGYRNFKLRPTWTLKIHLHDNADYNEELSLTRAVHTAPRSHQGTAKPAKPNK